MKKIILFLSILVLSSLNVYSYSGALINETISKTVNVKNYYEMLDPITGIDVNAWATALSSNTSISFYWTKSFSNAYTANYYAQVTKPGDYSFDVSFYGYNILGQYGYWQIISKFEYKSPNPINDYEISNEQINTSQNISATSEINVTQSTITNNANVSLTAGYQIEIDPDFDSGWGTNLSLNIQTLRSATIVDATEQDTTIFTPIDIRSATIGKENITINNTDNNSQKVNWIGQNTPNPFNNETVIDYYLLEQSTTASIQVNDLTGRIVKSFPLLEKGQGKLIIQKSELSKGVYTYSLIVDNKLIATKKMVIK